MKLWIKTILKANKTRREDIITLKSVIDVLDCVIINPDVQEVVKTELDLGARIHLIRMFARKGGKA